MGRANYPIVQRRAKKYAEKGHEVHVISFFSSSIEGCAVHLVPSNPLLNRLKLHYVFGIPPVNKLLKKIKPDIIDAHGVTSYGLYLLINSFSASVATVYGPDIYDNAANSFILKLLSRSVVNKADLVIGSTSSIKDFVADILGIHLGTKLRIRRGGIAVDEITENADERRLKIRDELGVSIETKVVLHSRHISRFWQVDLLIDAIPKILDKHPNSEFWFAYPPPNKDGLILLEEIREKIEKFDIKDKVRLLGGHDYERMISIMHASDIYVCVGINDLLAASVQEAACTGLIPVLSDLPAYYKLIKEGENGFFIQEVTPSNIAEKVNYVIERFDILQPTISRLNRERIEKDFYLEHGINWLLEQYQEARRVHANGVSKK